MSHVRLNLTEKHIDYLVNNAAIFGNMELAGLTNVDYDYLDRFMKVNLMGALHCTRSVMNAMGDGGAIVNQSSTASWTRASAAILKSRSVS